MKKQSFLYSIAICFLVGVGVELAAQPETGSRLSIAAGPDVSVFTRFGRAVKGEFNVEQLPQVEPRIRIDYERSIGDGRCWWRIGLSYVNIREKLRYRSFDITPPRSVGERLEVTSLPLALRIGVNREFYVDLEGSANLLTNKSFRSPSGIVPGVGFGLGFQRRLGLPALFFLQAFVRGLPTYSVPHLYEYFQKGWSFGKPRKCFALEFGMRWEL
jgi:hypothetical protein